VGYRYVAELLDLQVAMPWLLRHLWWTLKPSVIPHRTHRRNGERAGPPGRVPGRAHGQCTEGQQSLTGDAGGKAVGELR
jgi:hypothetical protein